ncbi:MAG: helix-turn-helix domain-containing protein [Acidobacteria bacterium]|nr:helix-turn-helix domain-containing protein [Acidobacteriota bacterium]
MPFDSRTTELGETPFLTLGEVIRYLRVNPRTVYRLIRSGELPANRIGRQWRIRRSDLDWWLEKQRVGSPAVVSPDDSRDRAHRGSNEQSQEVAASVEKSCAGTAPA